MKMEMGRNLDPGPSGVLGKGATLPSDVTLVNSNECLITERGFEPPACASPHARAEFGLRAASAAAASGVKGSLAEGTQGNEIAFPINRPAPALDGVDLESGPGAASLATPAVSNVQPPISAPYRSRLV